MTQTALAWLKDLTGLYTPTLAQFGAAKSHRVDHTFQALLAKAFHGEFSINAGGPQ